MSTSYIAAAVQFEPRFGDKAWNLERLLELTAESFRRGARLVVHPEMATTGYAWAGRAEVAPHVEPIPGPTVERFADLARRHGGWIVAGMPEVDPANGGFYNSAALIGPDGLAGTYRKTHPYVTEVRWARDGDVGLPVFDTPLGRLGILICMDAEYPEAARVLALAGCDVVCFPTNWLSEKSPSAYWIQRAWENGTYWVCANRVGLERSIRFSGGSAILGPEGEVLASLDDGHGIVLSRIDPGRAATVRARRLADRLAPPIPGDDAQLVPVARCPHRQAKRRRRARGAKPGSLTGRHTHRRRRRDE